MTETTGSKLAAIQIRGELGVRGDVREALSSLGLRRKNACSVLPDTKEVRGALVKCKDVITFGSVNDETIKLMETIYAEDIELWAEMKKKKRA